MIFHYGVHGGTYQTNQRYNYAKDVGSHASACLKDEWFREVFKTFVMVNHLYNYIVFKSYYMSYASLQTRNWGMCCPHSTHIVSLS